MPCPHAHSPLSYSDERQQPLTDGHPWCPVYTQWLQQWASHLIHRLAVHTAPAPSVRGAAAQQAQAVPHHPAAVRQRHLARDRGACAHAGVGAGGECTSYEAPGFPMTASAAGSVTMATTPSCSAQPSSQTRNLLLPKVWVGHPGSVVLGNL